MTLDALFDPESVAIIGASRDGDKIGHAIMRNFVEERYSGEIYAVNPNADEVMGYDCYDSVLDIDDTVDLAVVAIPASVANDAVRECAEKGVKDCIIITSGYKEIGDAGRERSEELQDIIQDTEMRVVGPNCLGVWDAYSGVDTLFIPSYKLHRPPQGEIAIITQSGSFGSAVMDLLANTDVGVSRFISYGNQADVTDIELIEWLQYDDKTEAVAVYMEGVSDGERFIEKAKAVTDEMPVIALKGGKSNAGKAAISSHTGSLAGSYRVYQGVFRQTGVLEAQRIEPLFDYARALAYNPPLDGKNIAIVSNGGGFGVLASDAVEGHGLALAPFEDGTREELRDIIPSYGNVGNPLDVIGDADPERFERALHALIQDETVDGIIAMPLLQPLPMDSTIVDSIVNIREDSDKPLVACLAGGEYTQLHAKNMEKNEIAAYTSPERAADAMHALHRYNQWRSRSTET